MRKSTLAATLFWGIVVAIGGGENFLGTQSSLDERIAQGEQAFESGRDGGNRSNYSAALDVFQQLRQDNETPYADRLKLTAKIVGVRLALGDDVEAVSEFLLLCQADYSATFLDDVPLFWAVASSEILNAKSRSLEQVVLPWLEKTNNPSKKWNPVAQLLAASVLLNSGQYREKATRTLESLVVLQSPDLENASAVEFCQKISLLATAQLWRLKLGRQDLTEANVDFWRETLKKLPNSLRFGPYFLVGEGYRFLKRPEKAADAYARVPTLYPEQRTLAVLSLKRAIEALEELRQFRDAGILKKELRTKFNEEIR